MGLQENKEKGMTLVELLAAITILGIVLLGLLYIFPQMTNFNLQTEVKLETMNEARAELVNLKDGTMVLEEKYVIPTSNSKIKRYRYSRDISKYIYEVDYYIEADLNKVADIAETVQLNKIHIKVFDDDKVISETFGYLQSK